MGYGKLPEIEHSERPVGAYCGKHVLALGEGEVIDLRKRRRRRSVTGQRAGGHKASELILERQDLTMNNKRLQVDNQQENICCIC